MNFMVDLLAWLWEVATGPVLDALGITNVPGKGDDWPHVWWIVPGSLSFFPIHAAGYHAKGSNKNVIDRDISSYIPTIRSLFYAREKMADLNDLEASSHVDVLLVAMPTTPGQNDLPFANDEVQGIANLFQPSTAVLSLKNPSKNDVLTCLNEARTVHFACHGISSSIEPGQSMLCLNDWQTEPLTVSDIALLKLSRSQLAYLSACHAANNRSGTLLDEAIHIAGACQMTGFPNVIETLWHVNDAHSSRVANEFYLGLLEHNEINAQRPAISLHKAVHHLRERLRREPGFTREIIPDPLVWAAYIHSGA